MECSATAQCVFHKALALDFCQHFWDPIARRHDGSVLPQDHMPTARAAPQGGNSGEHRSSTVIQFDVTSQGLRKCLLHCTTGRQSLTPDPTHSLGVVPQPPREAEPLPGAGQHLVLKQVGAEAHQRAAKGRHVHEALWLALPICCACWV